MKKVLSVALTLILLFSAVYAFPFEQASAEEAEPVYETDTYLPEEEYTEEIYEGTGSLEYAFDGTFIRDYVDNETLDEAGHVARINEEEALNTYVFLNRDGTKSVYYMDDNVRYVDENGKKVEKDLTIIRKNKGYTLKANDVKLWFPDVLSDGISVKYDEYHLTLYPQGVADTKEAVIDEYERITYPGVFGENTVLAYTPTLSGLKEDIILSEYTGQLSYDFLIHTHGMRILEQDGKYIVKKPGNGNKETFELGAVQIYDSAGNFCVGEMKITEQNNGSKYMLTLIAPEEFLTDPDTVYPVTIDPSITVSDNVNGAGAIEDSVIYSGTPNSNYGGFTYLTVGYGDSTYGVGRAIFRLPGLYNSDLYKSLSASQITSVKFYTWDASGHDTRPINILANVNIPWTESGVTWRNVPGGYPGLSPVTANMPSGNFACFDITSIVEWWKAGNSPAGGFTMMNPNETSDLYKKVPCSSETAITDRRPYVVMTYTGSVDVSVQTTYLLVGGTKQVTCTTIPTGLAVSWSSSNTSVATVSSSGLVTGISEGTVTITATYTDTVTGISSYDYVVLTVKDSLGIKDDTEYYIMNYSSKRYLSLETATDTSNTNVYTRLRDTSDLSKWTTEKQSDGTYQLISVYSFTGKCLRVSGTNVVIYTDMGGSYLNFSIYRINSGTYQGLYYIRYGNYYVAQDTNYNVYLTTSLSPYAVWSFMAVEKRDATIYSFKYPEYDSTENNAIFGSTFDALGYSGIINRINKTAEDAYADLRYSSDVFVFRGHGNPAIIGFYDSEGSITSRIYANSCLGVSSSNRYIDSCDENQLALLRVVLYLGCSTGVNRIYGGNTYNLVDSTYKKGAHFVLGTKQTVNVAQSNTFLLEFLTRLQTGNYNVLECVNAGIEKVGYDSDGFYIYDVYYLGDGSQNLN